MLSEKQVKKFRKIYKEYCGNEISDEEALELGVDLVNLMRVVYRPMSGEEFNRLKNYCENNK